MDTLAHQHGSLVPLAEWLAARTLPTADALKRSGEYLFEIIMRRYETRSTIMTSNRPLEDWGKLIGDVPSATAILDRFLHHAAIITINGKSYRLRNQQPPAPEEAEASSKPANAPTGSNSK